MLRWTLRIVLAAGLLVLIAGLLGSLSPMLDLANLAALPVAISCVFLAVALIFLARGWIHKSVMALIALFAGIVALPPADAPADCAPDGAKLRIAWLNAQGSNDPGPIIAWLERENPDAIGFAELGNGSPATRAAIERLYPHFQSCLANQRCSTIIYSRARPAASQPLGYGNPHNRNGLSASRITLDIEAERQLNLIAVHLSRPLPLGDQRDELSTVELQIDRPVDTVIIGDFNTNRRMHTLRDFARRNGLATAAADAPTWPLRWDGKETSAVLQIDQLLVGRNWAVDALRVSEDLGSDHRGLVGDVCRRI